MHPIFSLDNLSRLPASVRDLAIAATTSPTKPDIRLLATRARGLTLSQRMLLFPVPYSLLDPAKIPIVDDLDGRFSLERIASAIVRAKFAFDLIMVTAEDIPMIPKKAFQDLWGRAWEWISFLETQPYTHLDPIGDDRPVIDLRALIYINQFLPGSNTRQMIYSTPGVCGTVAKIWAAAVLSGSCIVPNGIFGGLSYFIGACDSLNDTLLGEFVEGSGGCLRDFSSLIVRHIDFFASGANGSQVPDITPANIGTYLDAVLTFLFNAMLIPEIRNKTRFMEGLISQGIIAALSSAAQTLEGSIPERSAHALRTAERCWDLLDRILADHECSPRGLSDGLHAGLLLAIVSGCDGARTCDTLRSLRNILSTNLPAFTSYHSVLTHVKGCFNDELLKAVTAEEFKGCSIYTEWHYFVTLMIERFKLLDWFNSRDVESLKGCDNMKCGGIHPKSELMRCAGCFSMYYCSKACQSRDWREGHHRDSCSKLRGSRFRWHHHTRQIILARTGPSRLQGGQRGHTLSLGVACHG
ncbi:hypothetical protein C8R47DRAFT_1195357 [Mycena vitilis]|nr:hypothetical protein C8R47DRAFT_1195357 [Mycena vitilis]